jgi:phage baseplate assembly protein gpV
VLIMAKDAYDDKAEEYRRQAREMESTTSVPASLEKSVKQKAEDVRVQKQESKAPTTSTTMGKAFKKGGSVSSASGRADGCAQRGKTKGRIV